ncbi:hypothetical protein HSBAA_47530 [Vreelandella sulfidaeris]|uniref:NADH:quinone oxidoreductase/Mrp antiporter transmembrane domain-containing protein n=1 Tax=Vreelandella sulfidaeris TaxID=115553 RepID=A0A455UCV7_9GAMM|nr:hypothetical protein HSBAA_47530 [Halomonas sulfidaeris]
MHAWLTPVHENAWTPVSALHAALVIKASLFMLLQLWSILLPDTFYAPRIIAWLGATGDCMGWSIGVAYRLA